MLAPCGEIKLLQTVIILLVLEVVTLNPSEIIIPQYNI